MTMSKTVRLCALSLLAASFAPLESAIARDGASHATSAPQQKSVRQSTDIKVPNKPATSRRLQKIDTTAVKTPAKQQLKQDFSRADKARSEAEKKTRDDLEKKKQDEINKIKEAEKNAEIQAKEKATHRPNYDGGGDSSFGGIAKGVKDAATNAAGTSSGVSVGDVAKSVKDAAANAAGSSSGVSLGDLDDKNNADQARKNAERENMREERDAQQRAARLRGGPKLVPLLPENAATRSHPCVDCTR